jgi:dissimilatory sulfite reductase related protein
VPSLAVAGETIELDDDGFVKDSRRWSPEVAETLARSEGVAALTAEHWRLINYMRDYYVKHGIAPMLRRLCQDTGIPLRRVYELFPSGPSRGVCRAAGLPGLAGCV